MVGEENSEVGIVYLGSGLDGLLLKELFRTFMGKTSTFHLSKLLILLSLHFDC